jgi:hypothetical protein
MEQENIPTAPIGIIFIATFWIFIGTWLLTTTSQYLSYAYYYNPFGIIPLMISIGIIVVGWGLLILKRWAYLITLFFSVLGLISLFVYIPSLIYSLMRGYYYYYGISSLFPFISLLFIPMIYYLLKRGNVYFKKKGEKPTRICPKCKRVIPFDANHCPYCDQKFETVV